MCGSGVEAPSSCGPPAGDAGLAPCPASPRIGMEGANSLRMHRRMHRSPPGHGVCGSSLFCIVCCCDLLCASASLLATTTRARSPRSPSSPTTRASDATKSTTSIRPSNFISTLLLSPSFPVPAPPPLQEALCPRCAVPPGFTLPDWVTARHVALDASCPLRRATGGGSRSFLTSEQNALAVSVTLLSVSIASSNHPH